MIHGSDGWEERLASWGATIAVIPERDQAVIDRFTAIGWRSVYSDEDGSILVSPDR